MKMGISKRAKTLLILFLVAISLRIALNVARQEIFFDKPFMTAVDTRSDDRTYSDAAFYIFSAKSLLEGKTIIGMRVEDINWDPESFLPYYVNEDGGPVIDPYGYLSL